MVKQEIFAFVTVPDHVRNELLKLTHLFPMHPFSTICKLQKTLQLSDIFSGCRKDALRSNGLNNIQFREKHLIIEATRSEMKTAKTIVKSNHSIRPQVVVNHFPENQDVFNRSKLVPGELSYTNAVKSTRLNSSKQNCINIFADSIFCGIRVREFKNNCAKFKTFSGSDSRDILHYVNPTLESVNYDTAVLHFGVNDLMQKTLSKSDTVKNLIENIKKAPVKCMSHGVSIAFVSAILRNNRISESILEEGNKKISFIRKNNNFIFVGKSNIYNVHLFDDGLHLVDVF